MYTPLASLGQDYQSRQHRSTRYSFSPSNRSSILSRPLYSGSFLLPLKYLEQKKLMVLLFFNSTSSEGYSSAGILNRVSRMSIRLAFFSKFFLINRSISYCYNSLFRLGGSLHLLPIRP
jgi:hypothetical protein